MDIIEYVEANRYEGHVGVGVTKPFKLSCEGKYYIAKAHDEDHSYKHILNEFVCYRLAKLLDLPIPDAKLIRISPEMIGSFPELKEMNIKSNVLFGSEMLLKVKANVNKRDIENITNSYDIPSIILFDQIILNDDRAKNSGNLLYEFKQKKLYIIDHTHAFREGTIWTPSSLQRMNEQGEFLIKDFHDKIYKALQEYVYGRNPFNRVLENIKHIKDEQIDSIFNAIPVEWSVDEDEKEALKQFIMHRIRNINMILEKIYHEIPRWKGVI